MSVWFLENKLSLSLSLSLSLCLSVSWQKDVVNNKQWQNKAK